MSSYIQRFDQRLACATACMGLFLFGLNCAQAQTEKTLYAFCSVKGCADGSHPDGITLDPNSGNIFGATYSGGLRHDCPFHDHCYGVVYEFSPKTGTYTELYEFCKHLGCADGRNPYTQKLVIDTAGNLYGTTEYSASSNEGGAVFELSPNASGWREKVLYTFCSKSNCTDGFDVRAGLTYAGESAGQPYDGTSPLYGTTWFGGLNNKGEVFSVALKSGTKKWKEQVLYSFCSQANCTDGEAPNAAVLIDGNGNIFGTTTAGGPGVGGGGAVFELSPNGTAYTESVLYGFCAQTNCSDGDVPQSGVVLDDAGNLFGTVSYDGEGGYGVVFELSPNGSQWQYNALVSFNGSNGANPIGTLLLDGAGGVYGTTAGFAQGNGATLFDFNGSLQTLYTFCAQMGCHDGRAPGGNLVQDAGNLLGTTAGGDKHDSGTLFEFSPGPRERGSMDVAGRH